jgi:hypothetical protein
MNTEDELRGLVVYESMFGSTAQIAHAVADGLRAEHVVAALVDVQNAPPSSELTAATQAHPPTPFDAAKDDAPAGAGGRVEVVHLDGDPLVAGLPGVRGVRRCAAEDRTRKTARPEALRSFE